MNRKSFKIKNKYLFAAFIIIVILMCANLGIMIKRALSFPNLHHYKSEHYSEMIKGKDNAGNTQYYDSIIGKMSGIKLSYNIPYPNRTIHQTILIDKLKMADKKDLDIQNAMTIERKNKPPYTQEQSFNTDETGLTIKTPDELKTNGKYYILGYEIEYEIEYENLENNLLGFSVTKEGITKTKIVDRKDFESVYQIYMTEKTDTIILYNTNGRFLFVDL